MPDKIEDLLGAGKENPGKNPATATPDGETGDENPLEKMDQISKEKPQKNDKGSTALDDEVISDMLKTGENTDGMFTPKEEEEHEEEDDKAKVKVGKDVKPSEKYKKQFKDDMLKHPDEYKVMTPKGEMTVAEALRAGYNPITKRFEKGHGQEAIKKKHLDGLNDADKAALEQFTNPANAQVAPADAEMYGLPQGSPMIRGQEQANPTPQANPMAALMGGGGAPAPAPTAPAANPIGGAMPGSEESMAPGAADLSALLGGGR